jgi:hypothetical protein
MRWINAVAICTCPAGGKYTRRWLSRTITTCATVVLQVIRSGRISLTGGNGGSAVKCILAAMSSFTCCNRVPSHHRNEDIMDINWNSRSTRKFQTVCCAGRLLGCIGQTWRLCLGHLIKILSATLFDSWEVEVVRWFFINYMSISCFSQHLLKGNITQNSTGPEFSTSAAPRTRARRPCGCHASGFNTSSHAVYPESISLYRVFIPSTL